VSRRALVPIQPAIQRVQGTHIHEMPRLSKRGALPSLTIRLRSVMLS